MGIDPQRPKGKTAYLLQLLVGSTAKEFGTHSKSNATSFGNLSAICAVGSAEEGLW